MQRYLTKRQFADALGVSTRTVERKVEAGLITVSGYTVGGHWRFLADELDRCRTTKGLFRSKPRPKRKPDPVRRLARHPFAVLKHFPKQK